MEHQVAEKLADAKHVAKNHHIFLPYAVNAAVGKYTFAEGKRRDKLRKRELNGRSTDAYSLGKRAPGSFGNGSRS